MRFKDSAVEPHSPARRRRTNPKYETHGRLPGLDIPAARYSDPQTSREAAGKISLERVTETQQLVLEVLRLRGPCTDEQCVGHVRDIWPDRRLSPQSIRSRRAELVRKGMVVDTGLRRLTQYGGEATVWSAS